MGKGEVTRQAILEHAVVLAAQVGLEGLTIGKLADDLGLSKSGLFAHFQSKESLQLAVIDFAADKFAQAVTKPAFLAKRGEPRVRALFEKWLRWRDEGSPAGGCFFVAASAELDDREGAARDRLVALEKDWADALAHAVRIAISEGHFRSDLDPEQFAYEMYGVMLVTHHGKQLLRDPQAEQRARRAFERLVSDAHPSRLSPR
jgi:AcrR family transcriptional regulator